MNICPHCGRPAQINSPEIVLALLAARSGRQLYRTRDGRWVYTSPEGHGYEIAQETVDQLVRDGAVNQTYAGVEGCYYLGPTIDVDATVAARKRTGNKSIIVHAEPQDAY